MWVINKWSVIAMHVGIMSLAIHGVITSAWEGNAWMTVGFGACFVAIALQLGLVAYGNRPREDGQ